MSELIFSGRVPILNCLSPILSICIEYFSIFGVKNRLLLAAFKVYKEAVNIHYGIYMNQQLNNELYVSRKSADCVCEKVIQHV